MRKVVIIYGAPAKQSRVRGLTDVLAAELQAAGFTAEVIYPQDLPAEKLLLADFSDGDIQAAVRQVALADAVVLATPVYKASYSGFIKVFLDMLPQKGLENKPVLPVAVGGTIAHMLVLDYAIRPVAAALANTVMLQGVYALDQWIVKEEGGEFTLTEELKIRLKASVDQLTQLV